MIIPSGGDKCYNTHEIMVSNWKYKSNVKGFEFRVGLSWIRC